MSLMRTILISIAKLYSFDYFITGNVNNFNLFCK